MNNSTGMAEWVGAIFPNGLVKISCIYEGRVMASVSSLCKVQILAPCTTL